ncbi:MAG: aldo/keto reductase [Thermoleophilia bacterium]
MEMRELGRSGIRVGAVGLGCMSISDLDGEPDEASGVETIRRALELGVTLLDTADVYGDGANERVVGRALAGRREQAVVATKCGFVRVEGVRVRICGDPEHVRRACDASLARLGIDVIDLYQLHRVDPEVPVEETVGAMAELVAAGKVRAIGLSEALPEDVRRAAAVAPIATLQSEWSLFERGIEGEALAVCRDLGIGLMPFAPLGRGILTGRIRGRGDLVEKDWRRNVAPRYAEGNIERNVELLAPLERLAAEKQASPGQVALAWLLAQGADVVPIPGTKRVAYLEENAAAAGVRLTPDEVAALGDAFPVGAVAGERYPDWFPRPEVSRRP